MSHLLSNKIRVIQSNLVNLKIKGTRDLFDTSLQTRVPIAQKNRLNETVLLCIQNICL